MLKKRINNYFNDFIYYRPVYLLLSMPRTGSELADMSGISAAYIVVNTETGQTLAAKMRIWLECRIAYQTNDRSGGFGHQAEAAKL